MTPRSEASSHLMEAKIASTSPVNVGGVDIGVGIMQAETISVSEKEEDESVTSANGTKQPSKVACLKANKKNFLRSVWTDQTRRGKIIISVTLLSLFLILIVIVAVICSRGGDKSGTGQQATLDEEGSQSTPSISPIEPLIPIYPTPSPKPMFTPAPSFDPEGPTSKALIAEGITYEPGNLIVKENGLLLSKGLKSRIIATSRQKVPYHDGSESKVTFHERPDFGATFAVPDDHEENQGGWIYTSNSEMEEPGSGGVGAITFNEDGHVIKYEMILTDTTMNCGGGRTPWGSWVSCEELEDEGEIYQVDPFGQRKAQVSSVGRGKGRFESFTYDDRNKTEPHFFASEDRKRGALRRFTPSIVDWKHDPWNMLHGNGKLEFLMLEPEHENAEAGTFRWTEDHEEAKQNAFDLYPQSEGIDRDGNELFLVTKRNKWLFVLDLDAMKYNRFSTEHGVFDGAPDTVARTLHDDHEMLYLTEERGVHSGIHGRNSANQFYTVLEGIDYSRETTGLSFSPDGRHLYFAFQKDGVLFDIYREDGRPFHGKALNVAFHNRATALS